MSPYIAPNISTYAYPFLSKYLVTSYSSVTSCGIIITCIFMYSGDGNLVLSYILLMSKHPNLSSEVDMTLFARILVVSNPDVSVLSFPSYYNLLPPEASLIFLDSSFCGRIYATNIAYVTVFGLVTSFFLMNAIEFVPLMRSLIFLVFPMPCINLPYSLHPDVHQDFCVSGFLWLSRYLNSSIWNYVSFHTAYA